MNRVHRGSSHDSCSSWIPASMSRFDRKRPAMCHVDGKLSRTYYRESFENWNLIFTPGDDLNIPGGHLSRAFFIYLRRSSVIFHKRYQHLLRVDTSLFPSLVPRTENPSEFFMLLDYLWRHEAWRHINHFVSRWIKCEIISCARAFRVCLLLSSLHERSHGPECLPSAPFMSFSNFHNKTSAECFEFHLLFCLRGSNRKRGLAMNTVSEFDGFPAQNVEGDLIPAIGLTLNWIRHKFLISKNIKLFSGACCFVAIN